MSGQEQQVAATLLRIVEAEGRREALDLDAEAREIVRAVTTALETDTGAGNEFRCESCEHERHHHGRTPSSGDGGGRCWFRVGQGRRHGGNCGCAEFVAPAARRPRAEPSRD